MTWWMSTGCLDYCPPVPQLGGITWPCPPNESGWPYPSYPQPQPMMWGSAPPLAFPAASLAALPLPHGHDDHGGACCGSCAIGAGCESECASKAPKSAKGACCGSCASGGACEGPCQKKKAIVGALYVSDAELNVLGEQIALMGADVNAGADKEHLSDAWDKTSAGMKLCHIAKLTWNKTTQQCEQREDPTYASYTGLDPNEAPGVPLTRFRNEVWTPFQLKWNAYRDQTIHEPTVYDTLRTEFTTLRDQWIGPMGQQTRSSVPAALDKPFEFPWVWAIVGTTIVLLPFILPTLTALYLVVTRGKSLGSLATLAKATA